MVKIAYVHIMRVKNNHVILIHPYNVVCLASDTPYEPYTAWLQHHPLENFEVPLIHRAIPEHAHDHQQHWPVPDLAVALYGAVLDVEAVLITHNFHDVLEIDRVIFAEHHIEIGYFGVAVWILPLFFVGFVFEEFLHIILELSKFLTFLALFQTVGVDELTGTLFYDARWSHIGLRKQVRVIVVVVHIGTPQISDA